MTRATIEFILKHIMAINMKNVRFISIVMDRLSFV